MTPQTFRPTDEMPLETAASILGLTTLVWPPNSEPRAPAAPPGDEDIAAKLQRWRDQTSAHFVVQQESVLAHARVFQREIKTARGPLLVGALASVCVHPDYRGRGWGADVVRAAFDFLPELGTSVALFQTGVPEFYEKLGCRRVENNFYDGTRADGSRENPWWNDFVIIYPASFDWPDGDIDLGGPGY